MISFRAEQIFIVTGATSGIGKDTALLLNALGATVVAVGRSRERLDQLKDEVSSVERLFLEQKDLAEDIPSLPVWIKTLREKYGKFSGLVCAAGIGEIKPLQLVDVESMKRLYDIDYFVPVMLLQGFADRRNNIGNGSSVVCISSIAAYTCERGKLTYSGAKAALSASMKSISRELASKGIRVNCVSPAEVITPLVMNNLELREARKDMYPLGYGEPGDISCLISFLLSDKAKWITGVDYKIDGGYN